MPKVNFTFGGRDDPRDVKNIIRAYDSALQRFDVGKVAAHFFERSAFEIAARARRAPDRT